MVTWDRTCGWYSLWLVRQLCWKQRNNREDNKSTSWKACGLPLRAHFPLYYQGVCIQKRTALLSRGPRINETVTCCFERLLDRRGEKRVGSSNRIEGRGIGKQVSHGLEVLSKNAILTARSSARISGRCSEFMWSRQMLFPCALWNFFLIEPIQHYNPPCRPSQPILLGPLYKDFEELLRVYLMDYYRCAGMN